MPKQKRILVVRPDRIGDVVLSTPIPREIKKTFPDSYVAVLLKNYTKDIYLNNPHVDKIILIDDEPGKSFFQKAAEIRRHNFTHSLTLLPTERINYLLFFAGIPYRIGVGHKLYQYITFTRFVDRHKYIPLRHEADYCMDLARRIGVIGDNLSTEIFLSGDEKLKVELKKNELRKGKKFLVGIHSTSGNSSPNWLPGEYLKLILELKKNSELSIAVTDNIIPGELAGLEEVSYPNVSKPLCESFINFAALDILISASTGPMHLAAALGVKTLSLFCPLPACSPKLWGPLGNESRVILPDENYCANFCPGDPKKCVFTGKGGIDAAKVSAELKNFLY